MKRRGPTARQRLYKLLKDYRWHGMASLLAAAGYRYGARLHELRKMGCFIETRLRGGRWEYRLTAVEGGIK